MDTNRPKDEDHYRCRALKEERRRLREAVQVLYGALAAAEAHLDYCAYGDPYEREAARDGKLPEQIQAALEIGEAYL